MGAVWGLGHAATIFIVGILVILLKTGISDPTAGILETAVGAMLVVLGLMNMTGRGISSWGVLRHSHPHEHGDGEHNHELLEPELVQGAHAHPHIHRPKSGWLGRQWKQMGAGEPLRAALVGLVHGLAGSAAVALLVLASISDVRSAVLFLALFGLGNIAGMLTLSVLMERVLSALSGWWNPLERVLQLSTGLLSLIFGLWIIRKG